MPGSETIKVLTHCSIPVLVYRAPRIGDQPIRHILVPTDGSALSEAAIYDAVALARTLNARVTGLCVEPEPPTTVYAEGIPLPAHNIDYFRRQEAERSHRALTVIEQAARSAGVEFRMETTVSNDPSEAIIAAAHEGRCDLIFMASHGRRGVAAILLGSVTSKVLTRCTIPVIVHRTER